MPVMRGHCLAQIRQTHHGGQSSRRSPLPPPCGERPRAGIVRKPLAQIDGSSLSSETRHDLENGRRKLGEDRIYRWTPLARGHVVTWPSGRAKGPRSRCGTAQRGARLARIRCRVRRCIAEAARGLRYVAAAQFVDALDVLPTDLRFRRHRVLRQHGLARRLNSARHRSRGIGLLGQIMECLPAFTGCC